jgi:class 3 adenylate cyclase/predicted ATPase
VDVAAWLNNLGLGQYEATFRDNAIDGDLLQSLTAEDLKDLGVTIVGHRRKLLDAIAALCAASRPAPPSSVAGLPVTLPGVPSRPQPRSGADAERRPITVMFCDLVGSTGLAASLDVEDWRNLLSEYLGAASAAVSQMGGRVAKTLGDGLMALFGHPIAQENDSERAVRAALAIQRALAELNCKNAGSGRPELVARIGIESGAVVVDEAGEIFGDAPNVAARVQALAEPGTVLITARVQRHVAGLFVAEEQGARELKGVVKPIPLYRIVRASGGRRFGARALTPLVGRGEELDLLRRRWERAARGEGQFVQIVGEPGIGKSRLVEEFRLKLGETPHTWSEFSSSQLLQNTPLHPVAEWGRQRFGVDEPADRRLADLENTLRLIGLDPAEHAPLLAPLVDIPLPEERAANLAPEELRQRQLAALVAWTLTGARTQPIALAFEDLHWADPTSLDLLETLAEKGAQTPLLILTTARPEFRPHWSARPHHSVIALKPLDRADTARMVGELAPRHALSQEVVEGVSERTGGVPLFVEEVTRLLLEHGEQGGTQAIPPTLQQSLAARLDRLGPARELAQIGAVLGRDFTYWLLRDVAELNEPALQASMERLAEADILFVEGAPPQANYRFKHALIQDAAYDSLLKSRRQALHRRAAGFLAGQPERANAEPEVIAHHFTQAGLDDLAIEWWGKAGDQSLRRSAFQEAIAHLGKAIEMVDRATPAGVATTKVSDTAASQRVKLQNNYAKAFLWSKGYAADETKAAFERIDDLAVRAALPAERFSALYGRFLWSWSRGEFRAARDIAERILREAEAEGRIAEAQLGHIGLGVAYMQMGDLREARTQLELALGRFGEPGTEFIEKYALDAGAGARAYLALALWLSGDLPRARELIEEATRLAGELGHPPTTAAVLIFKLAIEAARNDFASVVVHAENFLKLSQQHAMGYHLAVSRLYVSLGRAQLGNTQCGGDDFRKSLADYRDQGNRLSVPGFLGVLARLEAAAQNYERALALIDEALVMSEEGGDRLYDSNLHRQRGNILLKRDPANPAQAEEAFKTSLAIAKQQGARSFELLAALALAKLYQSTNRLVEAHAVLAPALEGFSPTPEMPVIAMAQTLLSALAETDEVKNAAASHQRRLQLQTKLGQAIMNSQGYASDESKTAFARARTLAAGVGDAGARFDAYYGLFIGSMLRGELSLAQETAESFLRDAENERRTTEAAVARRSVGFARLAQGDLTGAEANLAQVLRKYLPERDRDAKFRFGADTGASAAGHLARANWTMGDFERARALSEEALGRADETANAPTRATAYHHISLYHILRSDARAVRRIAKDLVELSREHGMALYLAFGEVHLNWALAQLDDRESGMTGLREALAIYLGQGNKLFAPLYQGLLAELEAEGEDEDGALRRIVEALALANETGEHWTDALLHRIRGAILLKRDPANTAPAEDAFQSAIAIAQAQEARSFELQAALSLAKLYQSTGRPAEAHAVLEPALEGFSPTPEMPEIAEAQALLESLA